MRTRRGGGPIRAASCCLIAAVLLLLSSRVFAEDPATEMLGRLPAWDSGVYPGSGAVSWMNDQTVVFEGDLVPKPPSVEAATHLKRRIIVWELGNAPIAYDDKRWADTRGGLLCTAHGVLVYSIGTETRKDGTVLNKIAEGVPGAMRERTLPNNESKLAADNRGIRPQGRIVGSNPNCDFYPDERMRGHSWTADAARQFYLDFGELNRVSDGSPIRLIPQAGDRIGTELKLTNQEATASCTSFATFTGLFYLTDCAPDADARKEESTCYRYWVLAPRPLRMEGHCIAFGTRREALAIDPFPTRVAMMFTTRFGATRTEAGAAGLYQVLPDRNVRIVPGIVGRVAVSPSGCRLAFAYAAQPEDMLAGTPGRYSVMAVDLCGDDQPSP
jgi:hypothetical protein